MNTSFKPGERWLDASGQPIQTHGGALLRHGDAWYWHGEDKTAHLDPTVTTVTGVSCYRSTDLLNWDNLGLCLTASADPSSPIHNSKVVERPKVLFNALTGKFVMWLHLDEKGYCFSRAGVAVAERPEGPFQLARVMRSFAHDYGWPDQDPRHQREHGNAFLDFNLFLDDDGTAYVFHVSENLMTLYASKLSPDFTDFLRPEQLGVTWSRNLVNQMREAPAPFKHAGQYYLFTSGCSGWDPNHTLLARSPSPLGPWEIVGDPFIGPEAATSFRTQPTAVFPAPGAPAGSFIFMANRWNPAELRDSRHVWLPFVLRDGRTTLDMRPAWGLGVFTPKPAPPVAPVLRAAKRFGYSVIEPLGVRLEWDAVPDADGYRIFANDHPAGFTTETSLDLPFGLPGVPAAYIVRAETLTGGPSPASNAVTLTHGLPRPCYLSDFPPRRALTGFGELVFDRDWAGAALRLGDRSLAKGLLAHLNSEVVYDLGGVYAFFHAVIGLNQSHPSGEAIFRIELDGREVFATSFIHLSDGGVAVSLPVHGADTLRLIATGPRTIADGHAVWGEARLTP